MFSTALYFLSNSLRAWYAENVFNSGTACLVDGKCLWKAQTLTEFPPI